MNLSIRRAVCSMAVLFTSAAMLLAQQPQPAAQPRTAQPRVQPGQPAQPAQPGQFGRQPGQPGQGGAQAQQLEPSIVTLLIIDNNKEIALAQLGEKTTKNEDIKHFCQMIGKDHSDFVQKLQERTGASGRAPRVGTGVRPIQPGADRPATAAAGQPARPLAGQPRTGAQPPESAQPGRPDATAEQDRNAPNRGAVARTEQNEDQSQSEQRITVAKPVIGNQPGAPLLRLCQEVAEKCLDTARKDAEKLSAEEFDMHFIGAQLMAHKEMLDKLQVFEQHVTPDTAQLLADAQETTKKHLDEAMGIMEQLHKEGSRGGAAANRTRSTEPRENRENR